MNIIIKQVSLKDYAELLFRMDNAIFTRPRIHLPARNVHDVIDHLKGCVLYMAYEENNPVGYIGYLIRPDKSIDIKGMGVLPSYQRKGIGTKLLKIILRKHQHKRIFLVTHPDNRQALHLYTKFGFEPIDRKENYYGDGEPRVVLSWERSKHYGLADSV